MDKWFTEKHTPHSGITFRVEKTLYSNKSKWQQIDVVQTSEFGRALLLEGLVMFTERDEFIYHEMIAHVPLCTHPSPENVLIIGGGDGGSVREVLRHKDIKSVTLVEIDREVVECCRKFFPGLSNALDKSDAAEVKYEDGAEHIKGIENLYDIIIVDSTDPIGPGEQLFSKGFYQDIAKALKPDGILVAQSESPFYHRKIQVQMLKDLAAFFPLVKMYLAYIPTYPAGMWSFAMASKKFDPLEDFQADRYSEISDNLLYYNDEVHTGAFALPVFVKNICQEAGII